MNDRGGFRRAKLSPDDDAVGKSIEFGRYVSALVMLGNDNAAVRGHPLIAPITANLFGQVGVERKASPRQLIEWAVRAPVQSKKAAGLA